MDNSSFEQVEIPKSVTGEQFKIVKRKFRSYHFVYGRKANIDGATK